MVLLSNPSAPARSAATRPCGGTCKAPTREELRMGTSSESAMGAVWKWLRTVAWSGVKKRFG